MEIELLDDLPLIGNQLQKFELARRFDQFFPDHGLWKGISGGKLAVGWLMYILTQGDHKLSHVEDWAALRMKILGVILEEPALRSQDFSDDRLGRLLDRFSNDSDWAAFEQEIGSNMLQVYPLLSSSSYSPTELKVIRTDSFNAPQFRKPEGLFTLGYSKQRRKDQPFCKVVVSCIEPSIIPLVVEVVKGSENDVLTYLPNIERARIMLDTCGNLYAGDSKLGSLANRTQIHKNKDFYLCPLGRKQCTKEQLDEYLDNMELSIEELPSIFTDKDSKRASAYFYELEEQMQSADGEEQWIERRILVYSPSYAKRVIISLDNRISEAETAIQNLVISKKGRRNPKTLADLQMRIGNLLKKFNVADFLDIQCSQTIESREVQRHKDRAQETRESVTLHLTITRKEEQITKKRTRIGWQIYASNTPKELIESIELVRCYRDEYRIEHLFDFMINRDAGILPIYLHKEHRVKGLIRLLSVGMKFIMLLQYRVREALQAKKKQLKELYPGNKNRSTNMPTTPMLLRAFRGIGVAFLNSSEQGIQMTTLKDIQKEILELLGIPNVYQQILKVLKTPPDLHET